MAHKANRTGGIMNMVASERPTSRPEPKRLSRARNGRVNSEGLKGRRGWECKEAAWFAKTLGGVAGSRFSDDTLTSKAITEHKGPVSAKNGVYERN